MTKRSPLAPGMRVHVYGRPSPGCGVGPWTGTVVEQEPGPHEGGTISVKAEFGGKVFDVHEKQVRRLIPEPRKEKQERVKLWVKRDTNLNVALALKEGDGLHPVFASGEAYKKEKVHLTELREGESICPPGSVSVSRDDLAKAWDASYKGIYTDYTSSEHSKHFDGFCKLIGLPKEGA